MNELHGWSNPSKRAPIFNQPMDDDCDVQVGEILDLLAALMRKSNRVKAGDQGSDPDEHQEKPSVDSQN